MKILVTGGAGYIGSVLVPKLLVHHHVTVVDNFLYGENSLAPYCGNKNFDVHKVDVRDIQALRPHLNADVIIPLAGLVGAPLCDSNPVDAALVNLKHPVEMFGLLSKDQLVIMPTTESAYGSNDLVCTEETPINPLSTYAKDKAAVEEVLLERENSISLRLATVFGMSPRMRLDLLINDFAWKAFRDRTLVIFEGNFKRTTCHVQDIARAFVHALGLNPGIYNVGAFSLSKLALCEALARKTPFTYVEADAGKDPDQRNYVVSSEKFKTTGFDFKVSLEEGLDELLKGYRTLSNNRYGNV